MIIKNLWIRIERRLKGLVFGSEDEEEHEENDRGV